MSARWTSTLAITPRKVDGFETPAIAISEHGIAKAVALVFAGFGDGIENARLIAAAPAMLEALKNVVAWTATPGACTLDVVRACARRTITEAEGALGELSDKFSPWDGTSSGARAANALPAHEREASRLIAEGATIESLQADLKANPQLPALKRPRVYVSTTAYVFAHGKQPRGDGHWAFYFGSKNPEHNEPHFYPNMGFAAARRQAIKDAAALGFCRIAVGS